MLLEDANKDLEKSKSLKSNRSLVAFFARVRKDAGGLMHSADATAAAAESVSGRGSDAGHMGAGHMGAGGPGGPGGPGSSSGPGGPGGPAAETRHVSKVAKTGAASYAKGREQPSGNASTG